MHYRLLASLIPAAALLHGCSSADGTASNEVGSGAIIKADGQTAGSARLLQAGDKLYLSVAGSGFDSGTRALHLHQIGACEMPGFTSAGGHLNPFGKTHGHLSPGGKHLGDLPNLQIGENGQFDARAELNGTAGELLPLIFDADGTAVMIHAGADDYSTDPTGAAGARIACAVLKP